jgi:RNA polymerase sigma-70 factor, ECF subfamily
MSSTAAELGSGLDREPRAPASPVGLDGTLGRIYREYAPLVWRSLRRLGVADAQLEDAAQDVFLVVHKRLGEFEGRSAFKTWLYGIAVRVAKGYRRTELRRVRRMARVATMLTSNSDLVASPYDSTERREASQLLHCILSSLPEHLRDVLVLVELEDLSVRDASMALDIRLRTCQRRLQAATLAVSDAVHDFLEGDWRLSS